MPRKTDRLTANVRMHFDHCQAAGIVTGKGKAKVSIKGKDYDVPFAMPADLEECLEVCKTAFPTFVWYAFREVAKAKAATTTVAILDHIAMAKDYALDGDMSSYNNYRGEASAAGGQHWDLWQIMEVQLSKALKSFPLFPDIAETTAKPVEIDEKTGKPKTDE